MSLFRRPAPLSRRDTDDVQLNTLDTRGKVEEVGKDVKGNGVEVEVQQADVEHGHMQELEVDMDKVLADTEIESIEADTSPYPEGKLDIAVKGSPR